jgi:hypothetical protein
MRLSIERNSHEIQRQNQRTGINNNGAIKPIPRTQKWRRFLIIGCMMFIAVVFIDIHETSNPVRIPEFYPYFVGKNYTPLDKF